MCVCGKGEELVGRVVKHYFTISPLVVFSRAIKHDCVFTNMMVHTLYLLVSNTFTFHPQL